MSPTSLGRPGRKCSPWKNEDKVIDRRIARNAAVMSANPSPKRWLRISEDLALPARRRDVSLVDDSATESGVQKVCLGHEVRPGWTLDRSRKVRGEPRQHPLDDVDVH